MIELDIIDFVDWYQRNPLEFFYEWKTDIVEFDSGKNQRNAVWSAPRRHWNLNWNAMEEGKRDKILEIFQRARGQFRAFLFKDRFDCQALSLFTQTTYPVVAVSVANDTFSILGNHITKFSVGKTFEMRGSTGNDAVYTVVSSAFVTSTVITVEEDITDATVDGSVYPLEFQLYKKYYETASEWWSEDRNYVVINSDNVLVDSVLQVRGVDYTLDITTGIIIFAIAPNPGAVVRAVFEFYFEVTFSMDTLTSTKVAPALWSYQPIRLVQVK